MHEHALVALLKRWYWTMKCKCNSREYDTLHLRVDGHSFDDLSTGAFSPCTVPLPVHMLSLLCLLDRRNPEYSPMSLMGHTGKIVISLIALPPSSNTDDVGAGRRSFS